MRKRLGEARVAHLATADAEGRPHVVPITFAHHDENLYFVVDDKPKRSRDLKRLRNIAGNPRVSVLVDHYEDDWTRLWWVRVDGVAHVLIHDAEAGLRKYIKGATFSPESFQLEKSNVVKAGAVPLGSNTSYVGPA